MTEVEMTETMPVSPDGIRVETWVKGKTYMASDDLLRTLIHAGAVAIVDRKDAGAAPENKALVAAPQKKRGRPRKVKG